MSCDSISKHAKTTFEVLKLPRFQFKPMPVEYEENQVALRNFEFDVKLDSKNVKSLTNDDQNESNKIHLILKRVISSFPENHPARILKIKIIQIIVVDRGNGSRQMWHLRGEIHPEFTEQLLDWMPSFKDFKTSLSVEGRIENVTAIAQTGNKKSSIFLKKLHPTCIIHCSAKSNDHDCWNFETARDIDRTLDPEINYTYTGDFTIILNIRIPIISANLSLSTMSPISNIARNVQPLNRKLLKDKLYTDMYIKTDSGTSISCHKLFLAATSPVIDAIFKDRLKRKTESTSEENSNSELKIENASDETIHGFLDFVYCGDIEKAINSGNVCVELLILANRYNVTLLEEKLLQLLFVKSRIYFHEDVESLIKCYLFLEMIGTCKVVEITLAEIINEKKGAILLSEAYQELTNVNINAAKIIEKCFLD